MKNENIFDRIRYIIEIEANGNIAAFARMVGVGDQTIRSIATYERNYPGYEVILRICQTFEWLSCEWLIMGIGEYKKSEIKVTEVTPNFLLNRVEELAVENKVLREENSRLKNEKKAGGYSMVAEPTPKLKLK